MRSAVKKMALGQVTFGPAFTALFFSINGIAQGWCIQRWFVIIEKLRNGKKKCAKISWEFVENV